ncbi:helix-turn-helix domain-containing protein [Streptomyces sp. NPDC051985]|uniref:PucR family transcriptional regulator n=1 Tax=Streptomyces sp. NPDC051985 TaxID=3155807 RepID=UPI003431A983
MSDAEIQALLDSVSREFDAAVVLEDVHFRLVARAGQDGTADGVDAASVVGQRASAEVVAWREQFGIRDASEPVRIPARPQNDMRARWSVPVRFRGVHLGYLWIPDADRIEVDGLRHAVEAAEQTGAILYRRSLAAQADTGLLRLLLTPDPQHGGVAPDLLALRSHPRGTPVAAVVARFGNVDTPGPAALSDLDTAVRRAADEASYDSTLAGVILGAGVLVTTVRSKDDLGVAMELAADVHRLASELSRGEECLVTVGGAKELEHVDQSWLEARRALRIVRAVPDLGPVACWNDLGIFRAFAALPPQAIEEDVIDKRVRRLLADEVLASTAETFLDLVGNVQDVAARLFLHRATVYQRLDRIAALCDLDLRHSGDDRLLVHLGLKLSRLTRA